MPTVYNGLASHVQLIAHEGELRCILVGMTAVERAERRVTLLRETAFLAEQVRANEAEHASLLQQRDEKCRELREAGASIADLQEALGVSRSRVQQILRTEGS